jgi:hypothetical protein
MRRSNLENRVGVTGTSMLRSRDTPRLTLGSRQMKEQNLNQVPEFVGMKYHELKRPNPGDHPFQVDPVVSHFGIC